MSRAKVISAALLAGIAAGGANAALVSEDDLIATAPDPADDLLVSHDFDVDGDIQVAPAAIHAGDDWDIRIDYAQTYWGGESNDAVQGATRSNKKKPNQGITLDNGIKKKNKLKPQQAGVKKKKKKKN